MKLLAAAAITFVLTGSTAAPSPTLAGCPVFPASSVWNQPVDKLPVAANSDTLIRSIGVDAGVHADFGNGLYDGSRIGIPYVVVHGKKTPKSRVDVRLRGRERQGARTRSRPVCRSRARPRMRTTATGTR